MNESCHTYECDMTHPDLKAKASKTDERIAKRWLFVAALMLAFFAAQIDIALSSIHFFYKKMLHSERAKNLILPQGDGVELACDLTD